MKTDFINFIQQQLDHLQYGELIITVHQGKVVQVSKTEKWRSTTSPNTGFSESTSQQETSSKTNKEQSLHQSSER